MIALHAALLCVICCAVLFLFCARVLVSFVSLLSDDIALDVSHSRLSALKEAAEAAPVKRTKK